MNLTRRKMLLTGTGSLFFTSFAGCLSGDDGSANDRADEDTEQEHEGPFNHADVVFLMRMIPHHRQAIEMAEIVPERTARAELLAVAKAVEDGQQTEIDRMEAWLEEAGVDVARHGLDHSNMDGMLSDEEMDELRAAEGVAFDLLFVDGMIDHHGGAIDMAAEIIEEGSSERVKTLAEDIINVQRDEIEMMEAWREEWEREED